MSKIKDHQRDEPGCPAEMRDEDIDTSNVPEIADFSEAVRGRFCRPRKKQVTLCIDADSLGWFRAQGGQHQMGINAALSEYVEGHRGLAEDKETPRDVGN